MNRMFARTASPAPDRGYVVRKPRPTDAIGASLRKVYDDERRLPAEFDRMICALDKVR
jgi:hypothetical protein